MPQIVLARNLHHEQIEFPSGIPCSPERRGGRGTSLHLQRGRPRDVTPEELEYIRTARPEVFVCLDVLPAPKVPSRTAKKLAAAQAAKAAQEAPESPDGVSTSAPSPKASGGRSGRKKRTGNNEG